MKNQYFETINFYTVAIWEALRAVYTKGHVLKCTVTTTVWVYSVDNRAARVARFLVQFFDVVRQTISWNYWSSDDNASPQW